MNIGMQMYSLTIKESFQKQSEIMFITPIKSDKCLTEESKLSCNDGELDMEEFYNTYIGLI